MKPNEYEFNIGDKVVTVYGEVGHIVDICKCDKCVGRGFFEPAWTEDGSKDEWGNKKYITNYMAASGFAEFRQIGKYRFKNPFSKNMVTQEIARLEKSLDIWKKRMRVMLEYEKECD